MSGKPAVRITDAVSHPLPPVLTGGPVSPNVMIGGLPAWLGINPAAAAVLQQVKKVTDQVIQVAEKATQGASGTPAQPGLKAAEEATKAAIAGSLGGMVSSMAAGASIHACTTPYPPIPHGPGVVIDASTSVQINFMPACFQGNQLLEPLGPPNKITMGCPTVMIGSGPPPKVSVDAGQAAAKMKADAAKSAEKAKDKADEEERKKREEAEKAKDDD